MSDLTARGRALLLAPVLLAATVAGCAGGPAVCPTAPPPAASGIAPSRCPEHRIAVVVFLPGGGADRDAAYREVCDRVARRLEAAGYQPCLLGRPDDPLLRRFRWVLRVARSAPPGGERESPRRSPVGALAGVFGLPLTLSSSVAGRAPTTEAAGPEPLPYRISLHDRVTDDRWDDLSLESALATVRTRTPALVEP